MQKMHELTLTNFIADLSSKEPVPGGGGASAAAGALAAALCSMVANLTVGKKKYEKFWADIDDIILRTSKSAQKLLEQIDEDAKGFAPLAAAYNLPKDDKEREQILESALVGACLVPMEILKETAELARLVEELAQKGSRLAVSDVGVAASLCQAAAGGAVMNIYINTKLMKNREYADKLNNEAKSVLHDSVNRCERIYKQISDELLIVKEI